MKNQGMFGYQKKVLPENQQSSLGTKLKPELEQDLAPKPKPSIPLTVFLIPVVIGIVVGVGYLFYGSKLGTKSGKEVEKLSQEVVIEPIAVTDFFTSPGWVLPESKVINGKTFQIDSLPEANWLAVTNDDPEAWMVVTTDFEVRLRVALGERTNPEWNPYGKISFYNSSDVSRTDSFSFTFSKDLPVVSFASFERAGQYQVLSEVPMPSSGYLWIWFENVGNPAGETVTVLNGDSGEEILTTSMPFQLFPEGSKLGFSFDVGNGVEFLTISNFEILTAVAK